MDIQFFTENKRIIILGIIILLLLISVNTSSWAGLNKSQSSGNTSMTYDTYFGLWNICSYTNVKGDISETSTNCSSIKSENMPNSFKITRICVILSLLLIIAGVALYYIKPEYNFNYILFISSGILSIIASITWSNYLNSDNDFKDYKFGYSWYFNLLAGIASIVFGVMIQQNKL